MARLRSLAFTILFYLFTATLCFLLLPCLFLNREAILSISHWWVGGVFWLERNILGLNLELRGREHLPKEGAYIVAAKHQSAYETLKLHYLFGDPAIVLKKELLDIPLWGPFLGKLDMIAINRRNRDEAIESVVEGAKKVKDQGRPIVIFPQGTRVAPDVDTKRRPYKMGVVKMAEATGLPVIPMALNSGLFWPRNGFWKTPGTVIFEFLPALPSDLAKEEMLSHLKEKLESASIQLRAEAIATNPLLNRK